jgi:carbamoyl-phosphate synthase large subunit
MSYNQIPVLIAGIGGASLGTEIFKCLKMTGRYAVYGCDISEYAYGHYQGGFEKTFLIKREGYVESIREICLSYGIKAIIPGGEEPLGLLGPLSSEFETMGVHIAANSPEVIAICSNKEELFKKLGELDITIPKTVVIKEYNDFGQLEDMPYPCIIKPATCTGGSRLVFLAESSEEVKVYINLLQLNHCTALVQEYIPLDGGEFTVGVLSLPDGSLVGSIAMQRFFNAKLSVSLKTKTGLISSGYSQGLIDEFSEIRSQAERIAQALGSTGPMNIQGRIHNGQLIPFEINPRLSASTYLRALAGFNEVDIYLSHVFLNGKQTVPQIQPGYYLRSLSEIYVPKEGLKR